MKIPDCFGRDACSSKGPSVMYNVPCSNNLPYLLGLTLSKARRRGAYFTGNRFKRNRKYCLTLTSGFGRSASYRIKKNDASTA